MATCSCGPRCKIVCEGGCGCVYSYEEDACTCECFDSNVGGSNLHLSLASKIDVSVKGSRWYSSPRAWTSSSPVRSWFPHRACVRESAST